jgi:hypothetical protein
VVELLLAERALPADAVHDLQRAVVVALGVGDELDEVVGLPLQPSALSADSVKVASRIHV